MAKKKLSSAKKNKHKIHCIARAKERYGVDLTKNDVSAMCQMIRKKKDGVAFHERKSLTMSSWWVNYKGARMLCYYTHLGNSIRTIVNPELL